MCGIILLKLIVFSIILKCTFSNVIESFTTYSEFNVYEAAIDFKANNTIPGQLTTVQLEKQKPNIKKSIIRPKCNVSSDCPDNQMLCTINKHCRCPTFHFWNFTNKQCSVNLTDLFLWFRHSISNDSEAVSQSAEFDVDDSKGYKILRAKWSNFPKRSKELIGENIYVVIWPIMLGFFIIALVYAAIIMNYL